MKDKERELLIAILKSNLSSDFKEQILREMFMPKVVFKDLSVPGLRRKDWE